MEFDSKMLLGEHGQSKETILKLLVQIHLIGKFHAFCSRDRLIEQHWNYRLKDSDVTWLYGPLNTVIKNMDEEDRYAKPKVSTTEDTYGLMTSPPPAQSQPVTNGNQDSESVETSPVPPKQPPLSNPLVDTPPSISPASPSSAQAQKPLKSALKKVTMSDLLKRSASELQINTSLSSNISISEANEQLGAFSPAVIASHRQPKLRFNQYVEQCVALSSNAMNKRKTSRVRMADLNDVMDDDEATEDEDDTTSEEDYDPDDSDGGSAIIMRSSKPHKMRSSIKKIEPALLKTNSRSDHDSVASDDSSSDEDSIMLIPSSSKGHRTSRHHHKQAPIDAETWDAESAESDAFVKHIINVSKGKQPIIKDPAADRMPVEPVDYDTDAADQIQTKSDYDYEFDDDDWDSHSEHMEDGPSVFSTSEFYTPVAPAPPVGCQIAKAPANNQPVLPAVRPKVERSLSDTKASDEIQQQYDNNNNGSNLSSNSNSSSSNSLFSSIAHWASSHLWPADDSKK